MPAVTSTLVTTFSMVPALPLRCSMVREGHLALALAAELLGKFNRSLGRANSGSVGPVGQQSLIACQERLQRRNAGLEQEAQPQALSRIFAGQDLDGERQGLRCGRPPRRTSGSSETICT